MPIPILQFENVKAILERHHAFSIELTELPPGEESRVYLLVEDGFKRILRVNRSRLGFEKDAFAYRHFHSQSLSIPAVLEIGDLDGVNSFCITSYVPGKTLQDLSEGELQQTLQPVIGIMQSIRESDICATQGAGLLGQHGICSHSTWRDFLQSTESQAWPYISCVIDPSHLLSAIKKMLSLSEDVPDVRCLIHGDFGSGNVLTDGGSITAVIDWSEAMIGDPLYDLANIFFWRTWLQCMEHQASYFENTLFLEESARKRLLCYQLHIGLREVRESAITEDWPAAAWAMTRLKTLLGQP